MTDRTCRGCGENPLQDQLAICQRCETQTRYRLRDQAEHRRELLIAMSRMVQMNAPTNGSKAPAEHLMWASWGDRFLEDITDKQIQELARSLPPARLPANVLHEQKGLLVSWVKFLVEEMGAPWPRSEAIGVLAAHVEACLPRMRTCEIAPDLVQELRVLEVRVIKAIDTPPDRVRVPAGPCPELPEGYAGYCPGQVTAFFPRDKEQRPFMRCNTCGKTWFTEQWETAGPAILRRLEALRQAV